MIKRKTPLKRSQKPIKRTPIKKKATKKKRRSSDSIPALLEKAQRIVNKFIRLRDADQPCISCSEYTGNQAGHYLPVKTHPHIRFHEFNINLQCPRCNCYEHGNQAYYRKGLVDRFGEEMVIEFENEFMKKVIKKWSREELYAIIEEFTDKIKQYE
jgi:hypothetical protein